MEVRGRRYTFGVDSVDSYLADFRSALEGAVSRKPGGADPGAEKVLPPSPPPDWGKAAEALAGPLSALSELGKALQNALPSDPNKKS